MIKQLLAEYERIADCEREMGQRLRLNPTTPHFQAKVTELQLVRAAKHNEKETRKEVRITDNAIYLSFWPRGRKNFRDGFSVCLYVNLD